MALMQIVISPRIYQGESISPYVAEIHKYLKKTKFPHTLHDMGTIVEGKAGDLLALARKLHELPFKKGVKTSLHHDPARRPKGQESRAG